MAPKSNNFDSIQNQGFKLSNFVSNAQNVSLSINITVPSQTIKDTNILWIRVPYKLYESTLKANILFLFTFINIFSTQIKPLFAN
jgi:prolipoprotein diacylglyceryltransferase